MRINEDFYKTIAERLKQLRNMSKCRQDEIAKLLCISRPSYAFYESGKREISIENVVKLADFYKVSTDYILGRIETIEDKNNSVTPTELELIKKYRMLDSSVQDAICGFIDASYAAVIEKEKENRA